MWKPKVVIVDVSNQREAPLIRGILENLGTVVYLHAAGTPDAFLEMLRWGDDAPPYFIICAHGNDNGIVFGEFIESVDTSMLRHGSMPPECISKSIHLPNCVVINTACSCGESAMVGAFMTGGLKAYIGTIEPDPDWRAIPLFIMHFFYKLFRGDCSEKDAWEHAASYDADSRLFVFYDKEGYHRLG